jgi:hypothetical protein
MSTKIFNGYRIIGAKSFLKLKRKMKEFGDIIEPLTQRYIHKLLAEVAVDRCDRKALGLPIEEYKFGGHLTWAYTYVGRKQAEIKKNQQRDPLHDVDCEVNFLPIKGKLLVMLFTEQQFIIDAWEKLPFVRPYPYWNNTDKPDGVSNKQWGRRQTDWYAALPVVGIPAENGFTISCHRIWTTDIKLFMKSLPKFSERVKQQSRSRLCNRYLKKRDPEGENAYAVINEYADYLTTDKGKKALKREIETVRKKLKKRLAKADLV